MQLYAEEGFPDQGRQTQRAGERKNDDDEHDY